MRARLITAILAFLILSMGGADLGAQERASSSIDGFNGMPWGSSDADIIAEFGEPSQVSSLDTGMRVLAYDTELLGDPAVSLYAILGDQGLIKGQHMVKLRPDKGNCEGQYGVYRDHVTLTYPLIAPIENYDYPFTEDFCTAIENGNGEWANQWTDPSSGSVVTVIVERGTDDVKLIYESATFIRWLDSRQQQEN
jgi:hypothetical protein